MHVHARIIPTALLPNEISEETYGEVIKVANMHERKSEMAKHADAFIALPGKLALDLVVHFSFSRLDYNLKLRWLWNHGGTHGDNSLCST